MTERPRWRDRNWFLFLDFCATSPGPWKWERSSADNGLEIMGSAGMIRFAFGWTDDVEEADPDGWERKPRAANLT